VFLLADVVLQDVKLPSISGTVIANSNLNLLGLGATIISLQVWAAPAGSSDLLHLPCCAPPAVLRQLRQAVAQ
jgi:hypothetical protein